MRRYIFLILFLSFYLFSFSMVISDIKFEKFADSVIVKILGTGTASVLDTKDRSGIKVSIKPSKFLGKLPLTYDTGRMRIVVDWDDGLVLLAKGAKSFKKVNQWGKIILIFQPFGKYKFSFNFYNTDINKVLDILANNMINVIYPKGIRGKITARVCTSDLNDIVEKLFIENGYNAYIKDSIIYILGKNYREDDKVTFSFPKVKVSRLINIFTRHLKTTILIDPELSKMKIPFFIYNEKAIDALNKLALILDATLIRKINEDGRFTFLITRKSNNKLYYVRTSWPDYVASMVEKLFNIKTVVLSDKVVFRTDVKTYYKIKDYVRDLKLPTTLSMQVLVLKLKTPINKVSEDYLLKLLRENRKVYKAMSINFNLALKKDAVFLFVSRKGIFSRMTDYSSLTPFQREEKSFWGKLLEIFGIEKGARFNSALMMRVKQIGEEKALLELKLFSKFRKRKVDITTTDIWIKDDEPQILTKFKWSNYTIVVFAKDVVIR